MKYILALFCLFLIDNYLAQITPPYFNNFDNPSIDTVGWSHYSLTGSDNWELGVPSGVNLVLAFSQPNVWATNLDGDFTQNSVMCLETPYFNFSDTTKSYTFGFTHQTEMYSYHGGNIEYTTDSGQTWVLLYGSAGQYNQWYSNPSCSGVGGQPAWSYNYNSSFRFSYHLLDTLKGENNVKFRFKFGGTSNPKEGWVIDNFSITETGSNIYGVQLDTINVTKKCPTFDLNLTLIYSGIIQTPFMNVVRYYWSDDAIFDSNDTLIGIKSQNVSSTIQWNKSFTLPSSLNVGYKYIFYKMDDDSLLVETNETDNLGMAVLLVDSLYELPFISNFDDTTSLWENIGNKWEYGQGDIFHIEGVHSGHIGIRNFTFTDDYIKSPHLSPNTSDTTVISFWYTSTYGLTHNWYNAIRYELGCGSVLKDIANVPIPRDDEWDFFNAYLPIEADTAEDIRIYINNYNAKVVIDDIYIGSAKADLSIERNKKNRFTNSTSTTDTLHYYLNNGGLKFAPSSNTAFYWSTDSLLDGSDVYLGTKTEGSMTDTSRVWSFFYYTKPTTTPGKYYILYILDSTEVIDEMREYNNYGYFILYQEPPNIIPYFNNFETTIQGWEHESSLGIDDWEWGVPLGNYLNYAFSGTKMWITEDTGMVDVMSRMHLYTPVFDLSNSISPVIEFQMNSYISDYGTSLPGVNFGMNMSYSIDGGATWEILDTTSNSYNSWYYPVNYNEGSGKDYTTNGLQSGLFFNKYENVFVDNLRNYNSRDVDRDTYYNLDIKFLAGNSSVRFRYNAAYKSETIIPLEGVSFDDFKISEAYIDLVVPITKSLMTSSLSTELKFFMKIKNSGNYISLPTTCNYYLSTDSLLDVGDFFVANKTIPEIRPDMYHYINFKHSIPSNLSNYKYLIYEIDPSNINLESNESNNIGFWTLALDSINSYPYYEDFEGTVVNGWNHYITGTYQNIHVENYWRVRNLLAPSDVVYQTDMKSGELFTERINMFELNVPTFYIESPAFNFSDFTNITLSFDLMCVGEHSVNDKDGGNMQYSLDGGNSWVLLNTQGNSLNWYTHSVLNNLDNEPGWSKNPAGYSLAVLDSTYFDLSFLSGDTNVLFRYKYRSVYTPYGGGTVSGMRIDNFRIIGTQITKLTPITICEGDSILIFGEYQSVQNQYYDTLMNSMGKDSIINQELNVIIIDTSLNVISNTLTSNQLLGSYQWLNCNNNYAYISGATNQNYTAITNGSYAVEITENGCVDTSACYSIIVIGINEVINDLGVLIYPNPNTGLFTIEKSSELDKEVRVSLLDASSRVIIDKLIPKGQQKIEMDITNYSKGVYYLQLTVGEEVFVKKILKN